MKKLQKMLAFMLAAVLVISMLPVTAMASVSISGASGAGTEEVPLLVDTYEELKGALEFPGDLYIRLDRNVEVNFSREVLGEKVYGIVVPAETKKVLDLNADICFGDSALDDKTIFGGFLFNLGNLEIKGDHSIEGSYVYQCRLPKHDKNMAIINEGKLTLSGDISISAMADDAAAEEFFTAAIENRNGGMTEIYGGSYKAGASGDKGSAALVSWLNAGIVKIHDGKFEAESSSCPAAVMIYHDCAAEISDGKFTGMNLKNPLQSNGLWVSDEADLNLIGGNFQNIAVKKENQKNPDYDLKNALAEQCAFYDYLTGKPYAGKTVNGISHIVRVDAEEETAASIKKAEFSGVVPPARGEKPDDSLNFPAESAFRVTKDLWLDEKNREVTDEFAGGTSYKREILLESIAGFRFKEPLTVSVNGEPLDKMSRNILREGFTLRVQLVYPAVGEKMAFEDVAEDAWYYKDVSYVFNHDIMLGHTKTQFGPEEPLSRAQLTQILYNMNKKPEVTSPGKFTDVKKENWFFPAVTWAAEKGYVGGYGNGLFGPEDPLTREQMATILFRYSHMPDPGLPLPGFRDADEIDGWAETPVSWAVFHGILGGKGHGILDPLGSTTRAEVAKMIRCYIEHVEKKSYLIHFDSRGGTQVADLRVMNGAPVHFPDPPVREGFTFVCWKDDGDMPIYEDALLLAEGEITLHAVWN